MVVLLDQEDGQALGLEADEDAADLADDERGEPFRRLVEEQHPAVGEERPADGQHLLLAARERAARLGFALPEAREQLEDAIEGPPVRSGAEEQVLADRERREDAASLRHQREAPPRDAMRGPVVNRLPSSRMRPSRGGVNPMMLRISVVLPAPFRPRRATASPGPTRSDTPWRTWLSP